MFRKLAALSIALAAGILVACGGRAGGTLPMDNGTTMLPALGGDMMIAATLPKHAIGFDLPSVLGSIYVKGMHAYVAGFTQSHYSQELAYPPGTKITIWNLSKTNDHTLNVVMLVKNPPPAFPANPKLSTAAHGGDVFGEGYASGVMKPGAWKSIVLQKPGTYIIGCAFHYSYGMRDVIRVEKGAAPGPQATAPPKATATPSTAPSGSGGGGWGGW